MAISDEPDWHRVLTQTKTAAYQAEISYRLGVLLTEPAGIAYAVGRIQKTGKLECRSCEADLLVDGHIADCEIARYYLDVHPLPKIAVGHPIAATAQPAPAPALTPAPEPQAEMEPTAATAPVKPKPVSLPYPMALGKPAVEKAPDYIIDGRPAEICKQCRVIDVSEIHNCDFALVQRGSRQLPTERESRSRAVGSR